MQNKDRSFSSLSHSECIPKVVSKVMLKLYFQGKVHNFRKLLLQLLESVWGWYQGAGTCTRKLSFSNMHGFENLIKLILYRFYIDFCHV